MKLDGKLIAKELKSLRIKNDLTVEDVCKNVSVNRSTLYKYERNADDLQMKTLFELLHFYGTNEVIFFKIISEYSHIQ